MDYHPSYSLKRNADLRDQILGHFKFQKSMLNVNILGMVHWRYVWGTFMDLSIHNITHGQWRRKENKWDWNKGNGWELPPLKDRLEKGKLESLNIYFLKIFIYLFLERGREGGGEGEKHQCVVASHVSHSGDLAHNPGMCQLGIKPVTLWFTGQCLVHWATPARVERLVV